MTVKDGIIALGKGAVKNKFYFVYQFPRDFVGTDSMLA